MDNLRLMLATLKEAATNDTLWEAIEDGKQHVLTMVSEGREVVEDLARVIVLFQTVWEHDQAATFTRGVEKPIAQCLGTEELAPYLARRMQKS